MMKYLAHSAKRDIPAQSYQAHICRVYKLAIANVLRIVKYSKYGILLKDVVARAAFYHDLGKLAPENQKVLKSGSKEHLPLNHVDAGVAVLQSGRLSLIENLAALLIYSHHIGLQSLPDENAKGKGNVFRDISLNCDGISTREIVDRNLCEYLNYHKLVLSDIPDVKKKEWKNVSPTSLFMRIELSCIVDADHTDTAHHYNNVIPEGEIPLYPQERLALLDKYVAGLPKATEADLLRQRVYDACKNTSPADKGFITCDSPVGTGKTTAVMAHLLNVAKAKKLRRIFVVLPFTNIIDQSVDCYRKSLIMDGEKAEKVVAAHHHKAEFEDLHSRVFSFLWNAPITVTTAVQFFETLASNHPASLRKLHNLPGSAIFIDEAHAALPATLWPQAWKWLKELVDDWGCYVVLASGSLNRFWELPEFSNPPSQNIPELVDASVRKKAVENETVRVNYMKKDDPLNVDDICGWLKKLPGPRLIILNTVYSAASVAKKLFESDGNRRFVEHLSTALAPIHRTAILERIKQRLKNRSDNDWTLVATSCVEAGIDFSFRTAAREFCSLVSTIQTAGRINRSNEYDQSELWSFRIVPGDALKTHPSFDTSARILQQFFDEGKVDSKCCTEAMKREVREKNQSMADENPIVIAEQHRNFPLVREQFKVISGETVTAIIDRNIWEKIERYEKVDYREVQQKSVSIYSNNIRKFGLKSLRGFVDIYAWLLDYDEDFLGYMAGVLKLNDIESYVI